MLAAPFLLVLLDFPQSSLGRRAGDLIVTALTAASTIPVGLELGRWQGRLLPYLPQLPLEWAALALAVGAWLISAPIKRPPTQLVVLAAAPRVLLVGAAAHRDLVHPTPARAIGVERRPKSALFVNPTSLWVTAVAFATDFAPAPGPWTSAARSPAIAPARRSPPSSTTPRTRCRSSSCKPGSDSARRSSTQHYARITPVTLTKAYTDAGYFARNVRTIEVLLDRDAITNGSAGSGGPFEFYDLGHGYFTYTFFEQCPHRMACARCDFYLPKESSQAQLLEAKDGLQRMLVQIPLTDTERAAVEGDTTAIDRLLATLADTPTPTGDGPLGCDPLIRALRRGRAMIASRVTCRPPPPRRQRAGPLELLAQQFDIHPEVAEHARKPRVTRERPEQIAHAEAHPSLGQRQAGAHHQHALQRRISCRPELDGRTQRLLRLGSPSRRQPRDVHGPTGDRSRDPFLDRQANAFDVRSELLQDLAGATVGADNPEQQVLVADVLAPPRQRLALRHLEHLLRQRGERQLPLDRLFRTRSQSFHNQRAHRIDRDPKLAEHLGGDPVLQAEQRKQLVLGLNRPARGPVRLLLGPGHDPGRLVCDALKHTRSIPLDLRPGKRLRLPRPKRPTPLQGSRLN